MMKEAITWQKQKQKQWKIENQMKLNDKFLGFLLSVFLNVFPFCTVYYMFKMALTKNSQISPCYLMSLFFLHLLNLHHFFLLLDNHIMFGIETNLVIKSLFALWLSHFLLFDCPLVKTSILFQGGSMS
jgi:heme/copper-type cytochrome/quinol oxidase subunit 4